MGKPRRDLQGLFGDTRRRVAPGLYNDMDRAWRQKYLQTNMWTKKDMSYHFFHLWDNQDYRKARLNVFRRVWQAPGEAFERALRPKLGMEYALLTKIAVSKSMWGVAFAWFCAYQYMYNRGDWTKQGGFRSITSKPMTSPNMESFPLANPEFERHDVSDYYDQGFKKHAASAYLKSSTPLKW